MSSNREISNNQILNNFLRFTKLREEFIYEYFRNDLTITDIKNILCSLDFEKFILVEESLVKKSYNLYENFGYTDSKYLDN